MKISICCPSYRRPKKVETLTYIPNIRVYVDCEEYEEYVKYNPLVNIVSCPKGIQGNVCRVRNYIIKEELKNNDAVCIVDDDMKGIYYWENNESHKLKTEDLDWFLEKYTIMAKDLGVYLWGINVNQDKQIYREYTPFGTVSYIGAPFMVFLKGNNCWFDERLSLKEDYDMTLQQLNKNRCVLRVNKFYYVVRQSQQAGGCAVYRNYQEEERQLNLLIKKWGKHIVKVDNTNRSHNLKRVKKKIDYNPIIRAPIRGV